MEEILPVREPHIAPDKLDIQSFRKALDNRLALGNVFETEDERTAVLDSIVDTLAARKPIAIDLFHGFSGNRALDVFKEIWGVGYEAEAIKLVNALDGQFNWTADKDSLDIFLVNQSIQLGRSNEVMQTLQRLAESRPQDIGFMPLYIRGLYQSGQSGRVAEEMSRIPALVTNQPNERPHRLLDLYRRYGVLERDGPQLHDIAQHEPDNIFVRVALIHMGAKDAENLTGDVLRTIIHHSYMIERTFETLIEHGFREEVLNHIKSFMESRGGIPHYLGQLRSAFNRFKRTHANDADANAFTPEFLEEAHKILYPETSAQAEQIQIPAKCEQKKKTAPARVKRNPAMTIEARSIALIGSVIESVATNNVGALVSGLQKMRTAQVKGGLAAASIQDLIPLVPRIISIHFDERHNGIIQALSHLLSVAHAAFPDGPVHNHLNKLVPVLKFLYDRKPSEGRTTLLIRQREWKAATSLFTGRIGNYGHAALSDRDKDYIKFYVRVQNAALFAERRDVLVFLEPWTARLPSEFGRTVYQLVALDGRTGRDGLQAIEAIKRGTTAAIFRDAMIHADKLLLASFGANKIPPTKLPVAEPAPKKAKSKPTVTRIRTSPVMRQLGTRTPVDSTASIVTQYPGRPGRNSNGIQRSAARKEKGFK